MYLDAMVIHWQQINFFVLEAPMKRVPSKSFALTTNVFSLFKVCFQVCQTCHIASAVVVFGGSLRKGDDKGDVSTTNQ